VAPDAEGLVTATPSKDMRRGLLLIAKIIQNLANNVLFGAKESYMFPLNDFLTQNIYRVTTFLREISVSVFPHSQSRFADSEQVCDEEFTMPNELDAFDFSSCVALHRFLFDNWDHVRQKIVARQKKGVAQGAHHSLQGRLLSETLRNLTSNLGPPPTDVSWNRPSVSMNSPPLYSRFQHFMLQNAGRSMENIISSQAVYDGGESKV
jgi:neurofibromin 1